MKRPALIAAALVAMLMLPLDASAAGPGKIAGTVEPVAVATEVEVCAIEPKASETCTYPDSSGTYLLKNLSLGEQRVEFLPSHRSHYIPQYFDHKNSPSQATPIFLGGLTPLVEHVDADLILGGEIEGTVTAADGGGPLTGVEVCALSAGERTPAGCAKTDSGGQYALPTLLEGAYKVGFWGKGPSADYAPGYFQGKSSFATATPVSVTAGAARAGVDATLSKGGRITGVVAAASSGTALGTIPICLFVASEPRPERCVYSDATGGYAFPGLPSGSYQVGFSLGLAEIGGEAVGGSEDDGYLSQYYRGVSSRGEAQTLSLLAPATLSGVNASLLTPSPPPAVPPPPALPPSLVAAPLPVSVPTPAPKKKRCGNGFKQRQVKGKTRCTKVHKKKRRHKRGRHS